MEQILPRNERKGFPQADDELLIRSWVHLLGLLPGYSTCLSPTRRMQLVSLFEGALREQASERMDMRDMLMDNTRDESKASDSKVES